MKSDYSWSGRDDEESARDIARRAARRSGMSLGEWLDEAIDPTEDERLRSRRARRRPNAGPSWEPGRDDEVGELAEAVSRLARQIHSTERQAMRALGELSDRVEDVERFGDDGRAHRRRDTRSLGRIVEELSGEMDDADSAARLMIEGLRGRASSLSRGRRDDRLDAVFTAISELDDRMRQAETASSRHSTDYEADDALAELRQRIDGLARDRAAKMPTASLGDIGRRFGAAEPPPATDPLARRFEAIEDRLAGIAAALEKPQAASTDPAVSSDLARAVAEIEDRRRALDAESAATPTAPVFSSGTTPATPAIDGALDRQLESLAAKIDGLRSGVERPNTEIAAIKDEIRTLRSAVDRSGAALQAVGTLSEKIETLAGRRDDRAGLAAFRNEIAELRGAVERNADATRAVENLGLKIDRIAGTPRDGGSLDALRQDLAGLQAAVSGAGGKEAYRSLDALVRDVATKVDALARATVDQAAVARLQEQIANLHQAVDVTPAMRALDKLEVAYADIRQRLDGLERQGFGGAGLEEIRAELGSLRAAMNKLDARDVLAGLESRIASLDSKVGRLEAAGTLADPRLSDEIARRLEELRLAVSSPVSAKVIETLEVRIAALAEKLDRIDPNGNAKVLQQGLGAIGAKIDRLAKAPPASEAIFASLNDQMKQINAKLAAKPAESPIAEMEARVAALIEAVDRNAKAASPDLSRITSELAALRDTVAKSAVPAASSGALEAQMRELVTRLEASQRPGADSESLVQLEEQVKRMAAQLEASDRRFASIGQMEQDLGRIQSMLSTSRDGVAEAAAQAAQEAIREFAGKLPGAPADSGAITELRSGLCALQKASSASDQRTVETLDAVQKTLKAIVSRLSSLESGEAAPRPARAAAPQPAEKSDAPIAAPAPVAATPEALPSVPPIPSMPVSPKGAVAPEVSLDGGHGRPRPQEPRRAEAPRKDEGAEPEDHRPLEPGSGKPRPGAVPPPIAAPRPRTAGALDAEMDPADPKASFIAAARRAAQAAAAEMAEEEASADKKKSWLPFKRGGDAAPAKAKAAVKGRKSVVDTAPDDDVERLAAELAGNAPAAETASRFGRIGEAIAARRRPLVLATAALLILIGSIQIFGPFGGDGLVLDSGPAVETPAEAPAAGAPENEPAGNAPRDVTDAATVPGPAAPAGTAATTEPGVGVGTPAMVGDGGTPAGDVARPVAVDAGAAAPAAAVDTAPAAAADAAVDAAPGQIAIAPMPPEPIGSLRLRTAASRGNPAAQYEVGVRYTEGRGVPQDLKEAASWYQRAADQNLAMAQYRLGSLYEKGQGVAKDLAAARGWYEKSAAAGNVKAMHNLAVLNAEGGAGKPDLAQAVEWFTKAAGYGLKDSQFNLGILYAKGVGVTQDFKESYKWFALAAAQGDQDAAKKRDTIANALPQEDLAAARLAVQSWQPEVPAEAANSVPAPEKGWDEGDDSTASVGAKAVGTSDLVLRAQQLLNARGYEAGTPDGVIGPRTIDAVKAFQHNAGLPASGVIDRALVEALQNSI